MDSITCSVAFDSPNNKISISGFEIPLEINYSEDIDFTQLVKYLCSLFDNKRTISSQYPQDLSIYTDKERIIIETLKSIFSSFNEKVIHPVTKCKEPDTEVDNIGDLPF